MVGALAVTSCTTVVPGDARTSALPGADESLPEGQILLQRDADDGPHTFGGTPVFDACQVLSTADVVDSGFELELGTDPSPQLINWHQVADGEHARDQGGSDIGLTKCDVPGTGGDLLGLTVYQAPFDNPHQRKITERVFSRDFDSDVSDTQFESEEEISGMRVVTMSDGPGKWSVAFFADEFYARMLVDVEDTDAPENVRDSLVESVAARLADGPTPPVEYSYDDPYSWVPSPCEMFTGEDFRQSWGHPDIGRVEERLSMSEVVLSHESGDAQHVRTSCQRQDERTANMETSADADGLTVELSHYRDEAGAEASNNYDCDGDKKYSHPFGEPIKLEPDLGDGHVCLMPDGQNAPGFTFKVGRTIVNIKSWNRSVYQSGQRMNTVLLPPAENVAERLGAL